MKRVLAAVVALGVMTGCATVGIKPLTVPAFDPAAYPAWNYSLTADAKTNICPMCHQGNITMRYTTDGTHECLTWACGACGATWRTRVAGPNLPK